ncbi:MAG: tetratricopeptide repeat protein [Candidatus Hodarchaeota archaeon]
MSGNLEFSDVFTMDYLDHITTQVEEILKLTKLYDREYSEKNFALNLLKLGIRVQNTDYISRAKRYISNLSQLYQSDVYQKVAAFCLQTESQEDQEKGLTYLQIAFNQWKDLVKSRETKKDKMSSFDYFNHGLRILESLTKYKLDDSYFKCKELCLEFINSSPAHIQPFLFSELANCLIEIEDKEEIIEYLELADKIVLNSSSTEVKILDDDLDRSFHRFLGPQDHFMFDASLFELQLVIAAKSKDISLLQSLLDTLKKMEGMGGRKVFAVVPQLLLAKTFYELNDKTSALNIINAIIEYLMSEWRQKNELSPSNILLLQNNAIKLAETCIALNEKDLAKRILPLLTKETQGFPFFSSFYQKLLLIELNEFTDEDLKQELAQLQKKHEKLESQEKISLPMRQSFVDFLESKFPKTHRIIDIKDSISERNHVLQRITERMEGEVRESAKQAILRIIDSVTLPSEIFKEFNEGNLERLELLLNKFEKNIHDQISLKQAELDQFGHHPPHSPFAADFDPTINQLVILTELAYVYLEVNKLDKAVSIIKDIEDYLTKNNLFQEFFKSAQPAPLPLQLLRRYFTLKVKLGITKKDIEKIISLLEENDPNGLIVLGVLLADEGHLDSAKQIYHQLTSLKPEKTSSWRYFYQRKVQILRKLKEFDKANKFMTNILDSFQNDQERWDSTFNLVDHYLYLGNVEEINKTIDFGISKINDILAPFYVSYVKSLSQDIPPLGVKQEVWLESRNYLKVKLLELISTLDPLDQTPLSYDSLVDVLKTLIKLQETTIVRNICLKVINTLQVAIETLAPLELRQKIEFSSVDYISWEYLKFLELAFYYPKDLISPDFWEYYKSSGESLEQTYSQFSSTYKRWFREYQEGNKVDTVLYISIPHVYESLVEILGQIGEKDLSIMCQKNVDYFQKARMHKVLSVQFSGKVERHCYSTLFWRIKRKLEELLKKGNYSVAKDYYDRAFKLLDQAGIKNGNHVFSDFNDMFGFLAIY